MKRWLTGILTLALLLVFSTGLKAKNDQWPRTVAVGDSLVTIYAPVIEEMKGSTIYYRAAIAYRESSTADPVFGAGWFESPVEIRANGTIHPEVLIMTETRFPDGVPDMSDELTSALAGQSLTWNLDFSQEELDNALQLARAESRAAEQMNTSPPEIIYRDRPALLVSIDGEPVLRDIENSPYQAVINTPYPLIHDKQYFYLNAAKDVWYRARKATGPYRFESRPPKDIAAMVENSEAEPEESIEKVTAANAPEIIVSTSPAELIVTEGPAAFIPLIDDLLVLENSDSDVFMHVDTQKFYIVLSGRWYQAKSLKGPWSFQNADELPVAFANIPENSDQAESRVYVAGTQEAREAVLDSHVPQTAAVERGVADVQVSYDGAPIYEPVDGTDMVYIRNTGSTVLKAEGLYYLVEDGVWYVSRSPNGPWRVSDYRPTEVDTILPTSPVYNSKYVYVYDSTPEVVYVGYTPGYTGSYVYRNTIYYGTGWYYRPWVSPYYYYPRHRTWGFAVHYNPWYGWNFGLSWGWGPFSVGWYSGGYWHHHHRWHHRHYGYWGPRGYRPRHHYRRHHNKRYAYRDHRRDHYRRDGSHRRYDGRWDDRRYDRSERHDNLYRDRHQRGRIASTHDRRARHEDRKESIRMASRSKDNATYRRGDSYAKKGEKNRTTPVSRSDLNRKAVVRDTNRKDKQRRSDRYARKGEKNRTTPVSRSDLNRKAVVRTADQNDKYQRSDRYARKGEKNRTAPVSRSDLNRKAVDRDASRKDTQQQSGRYARKGEKNRTTPVSRSDLNRKAVERDASRKDRRYDALAYNSPVDSRKPPVSGSQRSRAQDLKRNQQGKSQRVPKSTRDRQTTQPVKNRSSKSNRTTVTTARSSRNTASRSNPTPRSAQRSSSDRNTQLSSARTSKASRNKVDRQRTQPVRQTRSQPSRKENNRVATQPRTRAPATVKRASQPAARPQQRAAAPKTQAPRKAVKSGGNHQVAKRSGSKKNGRKNGRN